MSNITYPNGQVLTSTALTKAQMNAIIQPLTCNVLGMPGQFNRVRVDWSTQGQPFQDVGFDGCYIRCITSATLYSKIRDREMTQTANNVPLVETWTYTRNWLIHWTFYGPSSTDNARSVHSAMFMDYFNEQLASSNLYIVSEFDEPVNVPEQFNAQWWERTDFWCNLYEAVTETIKPGIATSIEIVVQDSVGVRTDITVT